MSTRPVEVNDACSILKGAAVASFGNPIFHAEIVNASHKPFNIVDIPLNQTYSRRS